MKLNLVEATIKALSEELDEIDEEATTGIMDGILVVTDPEITSEEYDDVIRRAQELVEDTPEGQIPYMEDYLGDYVQTCPICGKTFVTEDLLGVGDDCPLCLETPDNFVTVGKIEQDEPKEEEQEEELPILQQPEEEEDEEEPQRQVASKEIPQGNKLQ